VKRLLITGGSGFLGQHLVDAGREWDVCATYYSRPFSSPHALALPLDLRDESAVRAAIRQTQPSVVIHTACANRSPEHIAAIVPAAHHLALIARENGLRLIHLSTDLVFDGEHPPYDDNAPPSPITDYARAKAEAEAIVASLCPSAVIVRPSLIWRLDPLDHQTRWLVEGRQRGDKITLFTDEYRCPVHVHDLCAALLELAGRPDISGPLNLVGPQALNRWDFALKILATLGLEPGPNLAPGTIGGSGLIRARNVILLATRARQLLVTRLRSVDEVLSSLATHPESSREAAQSKDALLDEPHRIRHPRYCEG